MNEYMFDKRKIKQTLIKYGLMALIILPLLIFISYLMSDIDNTFLRILILSATAGFVIIIMSFILKKINERKEMKTELNKSKFKNNSDKKSVVIKKESAKEQPKNQKTDQVKKSASDKQKEAVANKQKEAVANKQREAVADKQREAVSDKQQKSDSDKPKD